MSRSHAIHLTNVPVGGSILITDPETTTYSPPYRDEELATSAADSEENEPVAALSISTKNQILRYVSLIGWATSILSLLVTVTTYLALRNLRTKTPSRIRICLCISLLCLYIVWLGIHTGVNINTLCTAVAALMHYFTLTSVVWMNIESYAVYLLVVRLSHTQGLRFLVKSCLIAWGSPLLIVGSVLVISKGEQYQSVHNTTNDTNSSNDSMCFMATPLTSQTHPWAFYYLNVGLIFLILLCNFFFLFYVIEELVCGRNFAPRYGDRDHFKLRKQAIYRTINDLIISVMIVITWIFGIVMNVIPKGNTRYAFVLLFSLSYFLQGFVVFLLFCVRLEDVRNVWKLWFCKLLDWLRYVKEPLYMVLILGGMLLLLDVINI